MFDINIHNVTKVTTRLTRWEAGKVEGINEPYHVRAD